MAINHKTSWLQEAVREIVGKQHYTLVLQLTAIFFISKGLGPYRPAYWDAPVVVLMYHVSSQQKILNQQRAMVPNLSLCDGVKFCLF